MIRKTCDRCSAVLEYDESRAGEKVVCAECGDVNMLPKDETPAPEASRAERTGAVRQEETVVRTVRPSMARARPITFSSLLLVAVGGLIAAGVFGLVRDQPVVAVLTLVLGLAALIVLGVWKVWTYADGLRITNHRTIRTRGLLSRSTSEVMHENIRNVQIDQTLWQRLWRVGKLSISSAGQDGFEIVMRDVPDPTGVRKQIDSFREFNNDE